LCHTRYIFIPLNLGETHWTLFAVDIKSKAFIFYNPLISLVAYDEWKIGKLKEWFIQEVDRTFGNAVPRSMRNVKKWSIKKVGSRWPQQKDSVSCGIFLCAAAASLTSGLVPKSYPPIEQIRKTLLYDILSHYNVLPRINSESRKKAAENNLEEMNSKSVQEKEKNHNDKCLLFVPRILPEWHGTLFISRNVRTKNDIPFDSAVSNGGIWILLSTFPEFCRGEIEEWSIPFSGKFLDLENREN